MAVLIVNIATGLLNVDAFDFRDTGNVEGGGRGYSWAGASHGRGWMHPGVPNDRDSSQGGKGGKGLYTRVKGSIL